jgi:hypothetical protein
VSTVSGRPRPWPAYVIMRHVGVISHADMAAPYGSGTRRLVASRPEPSICRAWGERQQHAYVPIGVLANSRGNRRSGRRYQRHRPSHRHARSAKTASECGADVRRFYPSLARRARRIPTVAKDDGGSGAAACRANSLADAVGDDRWTRGPVQDHRELDRRGAPTKVSSEAEAIAKIGVVCGGSSARTSGNTAGTRAV